MTDLISRQAALALAKDICVPIKDGTVYRHRCIDPQQIMDLPSAEPEPKWIPVGEALPKVRTDVLLAFEKNMAVGFYSHKCWNVNTGNGFYTGVFTDEDKPIAWMPLPEPWRGDR
jgi:hypothetical protein